MARDDVIDLALRSLYAAADEDVATGGPDVIRGIYPTVAVISANGFESIPDDVVAARGQLLIGGREEGEGL